LEAPLVEDVLKMGLLACDRIGGEKNRTDAITT
jgi:hypothetical protein